MKVYNLQLQLEIKFSSKQFVVNNKIYWNIATLPEFNRDFDIQNMYIYIHAGRPIKCVVVVETYQNK